MTIEEMKIKAFDMGTELAKEQSAWNEKSKEYQELVNEIKKQELSKED